MISPRRTLFALLTIFPFSGAVLLWSDEFDSETATSPDANNWNFDLGNGSAYGLPAGWGNGELQVYTDSLKNVRVEDNMLKIVAQRNGDSFTSGRIHTDSKFAFQYGSLMANISHPDVVSGLWPAFWTMGDGFQPTDWPRSGEIDICEVGSKGKDNRKIYSAAHWEHDNGYALHDGTFSHPEDLNGTFHIYRMEWNKTKITTWVDDYFIWEMDISPENCVDCNEFHQPHAIRFNVAVGGGFTTDCPCGGGSSSAYSSTNSSECQDSSSSSHGSSGGCAFRTPSEINAPFPGEMQIEWVRVFANDDTLLSSVPSSMPTDAPTIQQGVEEGSAPTSATVVKSSDMPSSVPTPAPEPSDAPSHVPSLAPTPCSCTAEASYNESVLTITFDMCDETPEAFDFVSIFPCDSGTMVTDSAWDQSIAKYNGNGGFSYGFIPDQTYVDADPTWWAYTCGDPGSLCQQDDNVEWPSSGQIVIDPAKAAVAPWFFTGTLKPGCYKVLLNRDPGISAPPYATACGSWEEASSFDVVTTQNGELQGLNADFTSGVPGGARWFGSLAAVLMVLTAQF